MSKERSISAHETVLRYPKLPTYRNQHNIRQFWPENDYQDKESLYIQLKNLKEEINQIKSENIKLKTRIQQQDKELLDLEKYIEQMQLKQNPLQKNYENLLLQLKKQNKDLQNQLQEKILTIEQWKKNSKATKLQEISIENKLYREEIKKLKKILQDQECSTRDQITQQSLMKDNFLKTQQGFIKQQAELNELKSQIQNDNLKINQLQVQIDIEQNQVNILNQMKASLEEKIRRMMNDSNNKKSSSNSFRSKNQITTEISQAQIKTKLQEELQYKLIIRGITFDQFSQMIVELKQQAIDLKKQIEKEDIEYILSQEPFVLNQDKIQEVIKSLTGTGAKLADSLFIQIGKYKTFFDFPNFKIEEGEQKIRESLKSQSIISYVNLKQQKIWNKEDIQQMLKQSKIEWDDATQLFYLLNLFDKSGQTLDFDGAQILNPFPNPQQESSRIIEESEEDLFEQKSEDSQNVMIDDNDEIYIS